MYRVFSCEPVRRDADRTKTGPSVRDIFGNVACAQGPRGSHTAFMLCSGVSKPLYVRPGHPYRRIVYYHILEVSGLGSSRRYRE
jgi:hypothetical protein